MATVVVGADIGQKRDPTAIVVCQYERVEIAPTGVPVDPYGIAHDFLNLATGVEDAPLYDTRYVVRSLTRMPLGTPYPGVARYLNQVCNSLRRRDPAGELYIAVDATGVGRPIVDLVLAELSPEVHLTAVTISGSAKCPGGPLYRSEIVMGKVWMVSRLQALLQTRRIALPAGPEAQQMAQELIDFEIRVSQNGHDELGAFKTGAHDDLVTALGLSVLGEAHMQPHYGPNLWR